MEVAVDTEEVAAAVTKEAVVVDTKEAAVVDTREAVDMAAEVKVATEVVKGATEVVKADTEEDKEVDSGVVDNSISPLLSLVTHVATQ